MWIFCFIPSIGLSSFSLTAFPQSGPSYLWLALSGNLYSPPSLFYPQTHILPCRTPGNNKAVPFTATLYFGNFKSTEMLKDSTINTHILFIYSPMINIFPYVLFYFSIFVVVASSHQSFESMLQWILNTSPKNKDILPDNIIPIIHLKKVMLIKYSLK